VDKRTIFHAAQGHLNVLSWELQAVVEVAKKEEAVDFMHKVLRVKGQVLGGGRWGMGVLLLLLLLVSSVSRRGGGGGRRRAKVEPQEVLEFSHDTVHVRVAVFHAVGVGSKVGVNKKERSALADSEKGRLPAFVVNDVAYPTGHFTNVQGRQVRDNSLLGHHGELHSP
jgi:hypothetical protein